MVEESHGKVTVNHRGGVFDGEKAPLLAPLLNPRPSGVRTAPKEPSKSASKGAFLAQKRGAEQEGVIYTQFIYFCTPVPA